MLREYKYVYRYTVIHPCKMHSVSENMLFERDYIDFSSDKWHMLAL